MASTFIKLPIEASASDVIDDNVIALDKTWSSSKINDEIDIIGDNYVRSTRFAVIGSGTNGTITIPGTQTVILDDFGGTTDAILSNEDSGKPDYTAVLDSGGVQVATTFDSSGNYTFTGTPVSYPVCIIYRVREKFRDYDDTDPSVLGIPTIEGLIRSVNGYIGTVNLGIDDLTDVDTTTTTPTINDTLVWDGTDWVPTAIPSAPVTSVNGETGVVVLDTDDVAEGATNLYYTEARVSANADVVANTAKVSADGSIGTHSDVDTTTNAPNPNEVLSWDGSDWVPAAIPSAPVTSVNGETGVVVLDSDDISEGATNLYYTETRFDTSFSGKDTDDLSEGATNLYYTEARVSANPSVVANTAKVSADGSIDTHSDVDTTTNAPNPNEVLSWDGSDWVPAAIPSAPVTSVNGETGVVVLDSDDISEGATNLYYTETRFDTSFSGKDTDDLSEGVTNLYFTDARVAASPAVVANTAKVSADGSIDTHSDVDTTTNAPSVSEVLAWDGSNWVPTAAASAPVDSVNGQTGVVVLDTDDISEGVSNLYFTDERVDDRVNDLLVGGDGITLTYNDVADTLTIDAELDNIVDGDGDTSISVDQGAADTDTIIMTANGSTVGTIDDVVVSLGNGASANSLSATVALGFNASAQGGSSVAVGFGSNVSSTASGGVALGNAANVTTANSTALGTRAGATGTNTIAVGVDSDATNLQSAAYGIGAQSTGSRSIALGTFANSAFTDAIALGRSSTTTTNNQFLVGATTVRLNTTLTGELDIYDVVTLRNTNGTTAPAVGLVLQSTDANGTLDYVDPNSLVTVPVDSVNGQTGVVVLDSDDISEGVTNLYYTETRFDSSFSGKSTTDLTEGTNLYYTEARVSANTDVAANTTHRNITSGNPHGTTYAQISAVDAGTDVTAAELENLSDGTNADTLHGHKIVSFAQYSNTDTTTDLNTSLAVTFPTEVPLTGTAEFTDADFTVVGNGIQCNFDGVVKVRAQVHQLGSANRVSAQGSFKVNASTLVGPVSSTGYIRTTGGHNESSIASECYISVSNGDIITYNTRREAAAGSVVMASVGTSNIIIERWIRTV